MGTVMIHYTCLICNAVTPVSPGFSRKKKKCSECGNPVSPEELQRQTDLWVQEQRRKRNRKLLLPMLLSLAVLLAIMSGAFSKSLTGFYIAFPALLLFAVLLYRGLVKLI
jgi:ribosomal protein L37E